MTWQDEIARCARGEVRRDEPLSARTAIRVGGAADLLVRPSDPDDLVLILRACRDLGVPWFVLGGGTNLLVSDRGVRGVVLKLPTGFGAEVIEAPRLVLSASAPASRLIARAQQLGLVGCEFLVAVPGTLGGNVTMNAGTRTGEMKDLVREVELATVDGAGFVNAEALAFSYRSARLPPGAVVTRVLFELHEGDVAKSAAAMRADLERRRATQPLGQPTFGSAFRNPPNDYAGRLIEAAGLKGYRVGGAMWSDLHANFVVNLGSASASDVLALLSIARARVSEQFGISLEPEVRLAGEWADDAGLF